MCVFFLLVFSVFYILRLFIFELSSIRENVEERGGKETPLPRRFSLQNMLAEHTHKHTETLRNVLVKNKQYPSR